MPWGSLKEALLPICPRPFTGIYTIRLAEGHDDRDQDSSVIGRPAPPPELRSPFTFNFQRYLACSLKTKHPIPHPSLWVMCACCAALKIMRAKDHNVSLKRAIEAENLPQRKSH